MITEGRLDDNGIFVASSVLAKHDENYMPSEVADALKDSGYWQEEAGQEGNQESSQDSNAGGASSEGGSP